MPNLTIEQAMQNIKSAVYTFKGTREEHAILEQCILMVEDALKQKTQE